MIARTPLTYEQAVEMLPDLDFIQVIVGAGFQIIRADWDRKFLLQIMREGKLEISGGRATAINHRICCHRPKHKTIFIQTKEMP